MKRIHRLIEQEGLTRVETYHKGKFNYFLEDKVRFGRGNLPPLSPLLLTDMLQIINKMTKRFRQIDPAAPWISADAKHTDAESMESFIEKNVYTILGKAYWRVLVAEVLCQEVSEVSLLDYLWGLRTNGTMGNTFAAEKEWIKESAYSLIVKLSNKLGQRIRLQSPVRSIQYDHKSALITTDQGTWESERVIVAIPPVLAGKIYTHLLCLLKERI